MVDSLIWDNLQIEAVKLPLLELIRIGDKDLFAKLPHAQQIVSITLKSDLREIKTWDPIEVLRLFKEILDCNREALEGAIGEMKKGGYRGAFN